MRQKLVRAVSHTDHIFGQLQREPFRLAGMRRDAGELPAGDHGLPRLEKDNRLHGRILPCSLRTVQRESADLFS